MTTDKSITQYFGVNLAELLSEKILTVFSNFDYVSYTNAILQKVNDLSYKQRIELHANELYKYLPEDYERSISILISILGGLLGLRGKLYRSDTMFGDIIRL